MKKAITMFLAAAALAALTAGTAAAAEPGPAGVTTEAQSADAETAAGEYEAYILDGTLHQEVTDGKKYLVYENGEHYTGWLDMTPDWRLYYDPADNGAAAVGPAVIDGQAYLFNQDGIWLRESGTPIYNGEKYWITPEGTLGSGWLYLGNWKMYFYPGTYEAAVSFNDIGGKTYLFNNDGVMQNYAGTTVINGSKYWFSTDDASLKTGWLDLGLWRLYFSPVDYAAYRSGLYEIDGRKYVFDSNGVRIEQPGTPVVDGNKYWLNADFTVNTGWLDLGGMKMYFFPETGAAAAGGTYNIGGTEYYFDKNGVYKEIQDPEPVSFNTSWEFAGNSAIHSGQAVMYYASTNRNEYVIAVNAGHGTSGGSSVYTLCHPDGTAKVTGGSTAAGSTYATAVAYGMTFNDGTEEKTVTLRAAQLLRDALLAEGFDVLMLRDGDDVQLDNVARTVMANNLADCHVSLHWDSDGLGYDKGAYYMSVPDALKSMYPVSNTWQSSEAFGDALIAGLASAGVPIWSSNPLDTDLTQTSYSTIPSVDVELGNQASDHSEAALALRAQGLAAGIKAYFGI